MFQSFECFGFVWNVLGFVWSVLGMLARFLDFGFVWRDFPRFLDTFFEYLEFTDIFPDPCSNVAFPNLLEHSRISQMSSNIL